MKSRKEMESEWFVSTTKGNVFLGKKRRLKNDERQSFKESASQKKRTGQPLCSGNLQFIYMID
ncbi:MAG: hypothetical protein A2162_06755 [Deltaproteobacteria bacterium RBG_13_52_11b]|nr:MAG: hypothetical protein A2162_06755 [Deltaproteobacteria bacterium RBG_13_52_11b]